MNYRNVCMIVAAALLSGLALFATQRGGESAPGTGRLPAGIPVHGSDLSLGGSASVRELVTVGGAAGFYTAPVGTRLAFDVQVRSVGTISSADEDQRVQLDAEGVMEVVVADRRADEIGVAVRIESARVSAGTQLEAIEPEAQRRLVQALASGILLRMGPDGSTLGYRVPVGTTAEHCAFWVSSLAALRFVAPEDAALIAGAEWRRVENDATGAADVVYRWLGDNRLEKRRTAYHAPADGHRVPEVESHGLARFDIGAGWLAEAEYRETLSLTVPETKLETVVDFAASCRLSSVDRVEAPIAFDWDGPWQEECEANDAAGEVLLREAIARHLAGARASDLVARLEAALRVDGSRSEVAELSDLLMWLIRLDDRAVEDIERMLVDPALETRLAGTLLGALGAAGTAAAQGLLSNVLADAGMSEARRVLAGHAMFQLQQPSALACQAATALAADPSAVPGLRGTGLLLLGAFARRDGSAEEAVWLLAFESRARAEGLVMDWLGALGNAGVPEAALSAADYLLDPDPMVRIAAVDAVRHLGGENAGAVLARGVRDPMPLVRARAVRLLAARAEGGDLERVGELVRGDEAEIVRSAALAGLARRVADPTVRALIETSAVSDPSAEVRALAGRLLARRS